jgi:Cytochrome P450
MLSQPQCLRELKKELATAMPDAKSVPSIVVLENLPYLTAVIYEALRLSNGVTMRLSRIDPEKPIIYTSTTTSKDKSADAPNGKTVSYTLPPGTPISMTGLLIHYNESYFPNHKAFSPERWLPNPPLHPLTKYLVPFTRGTRQCLGMNLAWAELYLALGMLFRRYGSREYKEEGDEGTLELFEFEYERDLEIVGDGALPLYAVGSRGVRIVVNRD